MKIVICGSMSFSKQMQEAGDVLVVNFEKNGIKNYIGANTFLEMGFAHVLHKRIFVLNNLPEQDYLIEEVRAMRPCVLEGDYERIGGI